MKQINVMMLYMVLILAMFSSCKKDAKEEPSASGSNTKKKGILVIENGAGRFEPGSNATYSAHIVDEDGNVIDASNITWSTGNSSVVSVSGGTINMVGVGTTLITATVTFNGSTITASVPVCVSLPTMFAVLPSGIAWFSDQSTIELEPVYVGSDSPGPYTYSSSNSSVATVNSSGVVTCVRAGECVITVTATGLSDSPVFQVPVYLAGEIQIPIPVTKVVISPSNSTIFKNEQFTFSAKAYDWNNAEVSRTFEWTLEDSTVASITSSGVVTALKPGTTKVFAYTDGILAEAELFVYPEKIIEVSPIIASVAPNKSRQFTAQTYQVTKSGLGYSLTLTSNPVDLKWEIPSFGIPEFDIATVNSTGLVTVKSGATPGFMSIVGAYSPSDLTIEAGAGIVEVDNCDCGVGSGTTSITPSQSSYNLSLLSSPFGQIQVTTAPAGGTLVYCSQDPAVVSVDNTGQIMATGPGTGTVTICDGNVSTTVTVVVGM